VVFLLDRSGVGGEDGQTHHGLLDFAATLPVPGMTVLAPADAEELKGMLRWTIRQDGPVTIRYARSGETLGLPGPEENGFVPGKWQTVLEGKDVILLAVGGMVRIAGEARKRLAEAGIGAAVVNCSSVKPLDLAFLKQIPVGIPFFTLEEHMLTGGFGMFVTEACRAEGLPLPKECLAVADRFLPHGSHARLMEEAGLSAERISARVLEGLKKDGHHE